MKPSLEQLKKLCPDITESTICQHLERLKPDYFERFESAIIAQHISGLSELSSRAPVRMISSFNETDQTIDCTILAFDYMSEFSLITGLLAGTGISILSGEVFTYERMNAAPGRTPRPYRPVRPRAHIDPALRRKIIDHFQCTMLTEQSYDIWVHLFRERLSSVFALMEKGDTASMDKARHTVNELVVQKIALLNADTSPILYPVDVNLDNNHEHITRLRIVSQGTTAFLYALSTALSLHNVQIEHVRIRTLDDRIEDELDIVNQAGEKIEDPRALDTIKLSVLLTKQFTYYLDQAPDPYSALSRFEQLLRDIGRLPESEQWIDLLADPNAMHDLAHLLGASDYFWEDFIRLQYEALMPILAQHRAGTAIEVDMDSLPGRLSETLASARDYAEQRERLNRFKDREIFLIDLAHILDPHKDFRRLSERLTLLAESIVTRATDLVYEHLAQKHGHPRTIGGLKAVYAIMGLGKLGGGALGYASDIELLYLYNDNGKTDGDAPIENRVFFSNMPREVCRFIQTKREGIFRIDLRLRPFGNSGPLACSLESFVEYYDPKGESHSYERLALVRMRAIGGDAELGVRVERLRNQLVYATTQSIDTDELRDLRAKQFKEKSRPGVYNAKFSPGALVDLEYTVQILQVLHGKAVPALQTPRIHQALRGLKEADVLQPEECERLIRAYEFLRGLINGLRMLRGSAEDLFLPSEGSNEFIHLARRMGYQRRENLEPDQQLHVDFETHTAAVRIFVERHLGRASVPGPLSGNVADLVIAEAVAPELRDHILIAAGFADPQKAYRNLRGLAGEGARLDCFARLSILACDLLKQEPDPDMALNNWERFMRGIPDAEKQYRKILAQPKQLELMLSIFSRSQFLADLVIQHPEYLEWVTVPETLHKRWTRTALERDLKSLSLALPEEEQWLPTLRRLRQREMLRIGTRDLCLRAPIQDIVIDLSILADAIIATTLKRAWRKIGATLDISDKETARWAERFALLALGKLGGQELNYSSDIDLIGVYGNDQSGKRHSSTPLAITPSELYAKVLEQFRADLSRHMIAGHVYRVDFRLRPYGSSGQLVYTPAALQNYYQNKAALWEIQALLKLRPVAGNLDLGAKLTEMVRPIILQPRPAKLIFESIQHMREASLKQRSEGNHTPMDVKQGLGGIRDIEFMVQGLQLLHAPDHPQLINGNTLNALTLLRQEKILKEAQAEQLRDDYIFLRRVEHYLQILHDCQTHALPDDEAELNALAKRVSGTRCTGQGLVKNLAIRAQRIRKEYIEIYRVGLSTLFACLP